MHCFFEVGEVNRKKEISVYLLMLLWFVFVASFSEPDLSHATMALILFVLTGLYQERLKKKLLVTVVAFGTYVLSEVLVVRLLSFFQFDSDIVFIIEQVSILALMYLFELLAEIWMEHLRNLRVKMAENENVKELKYMRQLNI